MIMMRRAGRVIAATVSAVCLGWGFQVGAQTLTIQSGSPTGSWYPAGVAITNAMQQANPRLRVTVAPGGAIENAKAASYGADTDMAMTYASSWHAALKGGYPFERPWPDSRFVIALAQVVYHGGVAADSPIRSYADLKGKRIMPGLQSWATNTMTLEILGQYGITYEQIIRDGGKVEHVGYDDMQRAMADRQTDFIAAFQGYPTALWINTHNSRPVRLLPVPPEVARPIMEKIPGLFMTKIPAGAYAINPNQDIDTIGDVTVAIAHKDYSADVVYQFVKTTLQQRAELMKAAPTLDFVAIETALTGLAGAQLHPGARRYYQEIGLNLPN